MSVNHLLDIDLVNDYKESLGVDIVREMFELYAEKSAVYLDDIRLSVDSGDNGLWHDKCHKLKGAVSSIGLIALRAFILTIEHSEENSTIKHQYYEQIKQFNAEGINAFEAWLSNFN